MIQRSMDHSYREIARYAEFLLEQLEQDILNFYLKLL